MAYPVPNFYEYILTSRIAGRPISAADLIAQLKLDPDLANDSDFVDYVNALIDAAVLCGEKYTKLTFQESNFDAYLDYFVGNAAGFGLAFYSRYSTSRYCTSYEIRRGPFQSSVSLKYLADGAETTIDASNYYTTNAVNFARLAPADGYTWPSADNRLQAITYQFRAGYPDGELPADLKQALLMHVAAMFSNRGDCSLESVKQELTVTQYMPDATKAIYDKNRVIDIRVGL